MARANFLWVPRIDGELLKLGIAVSQTTVSRAIDKAEVNDKALWVLARYLMVVAQDSGMSAKDAAAAIGGVLYRERDSRDKQ
jgi:hypothetical protein